LGHPGREEADGQATKEGGEEEGSEDSEFSDVMKMVEANRRQMAEWRGRHHQLGTRRSRAG
jgi:hypothetical protein